MHAIIKRDASMNLSMNEKRPREDTGRRWPSVSLKESLLQAGPFSLQSYEKINKLLLLKPSSYGNLSRPTHPV